MIKSWKRSASGLGYAFFRLNISIYYFQVLQTYLSCPKTTHNRRDLHDPLKPDGDLGRFASKVYRLKLPHRIGTTHAYGCHPKRGFPCNRAGKASAQRPGRLSSNQALQRIGPYFLALGAILIAELTLRLIGF